MTARTVVRQLLVGADALSVVCDQLDGETTPAVLQRIAQLTAQTYQQAAEALEQGDDDDVTRAAYANAAVNFARAGIGVQAERMRRKALKGAPMTLSLNGRRFATELPGSKDAERVALVRAAQKRGRDQGGE